MGVGVGACIKHSPSRAPLPTAQDHLTGVLAAYPVDVLPGPNYVEVRPRGVHKGVVLAMIMDVLEGRDKTTHSLKSMLEANSAATTDDMGHGLEREGSNGSSGGGIGVTRPPGGSTAVHAGHHFTRLPPFAPLMSPSLTASSGGGGGGVGFSGGGGGGSSSYEVPPGRSSRDWAPRMLEFVLAIGDDAADEEMFSVVHAYNREREAELHTVFARVTPAHAVTLLGGTAPTPVASRPVVAVDEHGSESGGSGGGGGGAGGGRPGLGLAANAARAAAAASTASRVAHFGAEAGTPAVDTVGGGAGLSPASTGGDSVAAPNLMLAHGAGGHHGHPHRRTCREFTVTVGMKPSEAQYYVNDTQAVEDVLRVLARASIRAAKGGGDKVVAPSAARGGAAPVPPLASGLRVGMPLPADGSLAQLAVANQQRRLMSMPANMDRMVSGLSGAGGGGGASARVLPMRTARGGVSGAGVAMAGLLSTTSVPPVVPMTVPPPPAALAGGGGGATPPAATVLGMPRSASQARLANVQMGQRAALMSLWAMSGRSMQDMREAVGGYDAPAPGGGGGGGDVPEGVSPIAESDGGVSTPQLAGADASAPSGAGGGYDGEAGGRGDDDRDDNDDDNDDDDDSGVDSDTDDDCSAGDSGGDDGERELPRASPPDLVGITLPSDSPLAALGSRRTMSTGALASIVSRGVGGGGGMRSPPVGATGVTPLGATPVLSPTPAASPGLLNSARGGGGVASPSLAVPLSRSGSAGVIGAAAPAPAPHEQYLRHIQSNAAADDGDMIEI